MRTPCKIHSPQSTAVVHPSFPVLRAVEGGVDVSIYATLAALPHVASRSPQHARVLGGGSQVPAAPLPFSAPDWPACALLCLLHPPLPPQVSLEQVRGLSPSTLTCGPPVRSTVHSPQSSIPAGGLAAPMLSALAGWERPTGCVRVTDLRLYLLSRLQQLPRPWCLLPSLLPDHRDLLNPRTSCGSVPPHLPTLPVPVIPASRILPFSLPS